MNSGSSTRLVFSLGCFLLTSLIAHAHRPSESSADFRWEHGRLEVRAIFSMQIAAVILDDPEVSVIGSHNFEQVRERLTERLSKAFVVEVSGAVAQPAKAHVAWSAEGEIVCAQFYPPMSRAPLVVQAPYLARLPGDCYCWLRVWRDAENLQGQKLLTHRAPRADFPASSPSDEPPPPP